MNVQNSTVQIIIAAVTVVLLVLLSDPFMLYMPEMMTMFVLVGVTALLLVWVGMVMNERAADEREAMHRMHAGRIAYLSGIGILTLALLVQGLAHDIDPWIAAALATMILAKLAAHLYTRWYH